MPSNPMQRKVRNSFFLGILAMLLIVIIIGVIVFFAVIKPKKDKEKENQVFYITAYRLKAGMNVQSGGEVSSSMIEEVEIPVKTEKVSTDFIQTSSFFIVGEGEASYKSKIDLTPGTILTQNMFYQDEREVQDSRRYIEYNMITMPTLLDMGDYVDVRLRLPNGQDLIVVSKKEVVNLYGQTVGVNLTEEEILILNSAIVEAYIMPSAELYMSKYVEPGIQTAAIYTYVPTQEVYNLIAIDSNIVEEAKSGLASIYRRQINATTTVQDATRQSVENSKAQYAGESSNNIEEGMKAQIEAARKAREDYLSELEGY